MRSICENTPRRRLFLLRKILNETQRDMACRCNIPLRSYQRLEYGEMVFTVDIIFAISRAINISPSFFLIKNFQYTPILNQEYCIDTTEKVVAELKEYLRITSWLSRSFDKVPSVESNLKRSHFNKRFLKEKKGYSEFLFHSKQKWDIEIASLNFEKITMASKGDMFLTLTSFEKNGVDVDSVYLSIVIDNRADYLKIHSVHSDLSKLDGLSNLNLQKLYDDLSNHLPCRLFLQFPLQPACR